MTPPTLTIRTWGCAKKKIYTTPGLPTWSPTAVLAGPKRAWISRFGMGRVRSTLVWSCTSG
eukprot:scaffold128_cov248-Pinguiococcus_pyrenoidosus.AAC.37